MKKSILFRVWIASLSAAYLSLLVLPRAPYVLASAQENAAPSKAECVMEINSRRVLYEERGDVRLPMASTTKIVTCITVLEACKNLQAEYTIPQTAVGIEGSSVYLQAGEVYTIEDLLYGLMLRSGNDCATALALYTSDSVARFTVKMNQTAEKAGALDSRFQNPHGLPHDEHYTTARDLSLISAYAMQNPTFQTIVSTKYYEKRHWKNKNKMLFQYDGAVGIKTGYTKAAGRCLVTAATRGDMTLVCTVLHSPNMYERTAQLLDDAFEGYSYEKLLGREDALIIDDGKTVCAAREDYYYPLLSAERDLVEIRTNSLGKKKTKTGEIVGEFEIYLSKRLLFSGNLYKL